MTPWVSDLIFTTDHLKTICYDAPTVIIQQVIKGLSGLTDTDIDEIFKGGIICNWWRRLGSLPQKQVPDRLTDRNLEWHRNSFTKRDPLQGNAPFRDNSPFISTTAGTVNRDVAHLTNTVTPAWKTALFFATDRWMKDGWLVYCHLFLIGKRAVLLEAFSEELRELNIYTGYSRYYPEGEITAKLVIPTAQIERAEFWSLSDAQTAFAGGNLPAASLVKTNPNFVKPDDYNNLRGLLI
jgi:hypothetical protein